MKILGEGIVDKVPKDCIDCAFNQNKYCPLLILSERRNSTFVQNNREQRDVYCPLIERAERENHEINRREQTADREVSIPASAK